MLKLKDVYQLPGTPVALTYGLRAAWLPEVDPGYGQLVDAEVAAEIQQEGRLMVRCVFEQNFDGDRFADMHTVWLDDQPVMVVRDGGRGGRDFHDRMITDADAFRRLCRYVREKLKTDIPDEDLADPESLQYPEELFNFYGSTDFASQLGFEVEPVTAGFVVISEARRVVPGAPEGYILVEAKASIAQMPEYVRRRGYVMRRVRPLTEEELTRNPSVLEVSRQDNIGHHYWYVREDAPPGTIIVKV